MTGPSQNKDTIHALSELASIGCSIVAGLLVAYLLLTVVLIPVLGFPGDLDRLMKLDQRLEAAPPGIDRVEIVSNSVGVEGIEARFVQNQLGAGFVVENQAANGLDLLTGRIYISRLLESTPEVLVWILRPELRGRLKPVNAEVASAMRYADFIRDAGWINAAPIPGLDDVTLARLNASDFANSVSLRTIPLRHLNEIVRTKTRKGILPAKPMELDAPYQIDTVITGDKLARHISDITASYHERTAADNRDGIMFIEQTVRQIQDASTLPVLVIAPTNPGAVDFGKADADFLDELGEISRRTGAPLINLAGLLSAEEFADAIHPDRAGAEHLSRVLGEKLAGVLSGPDAGN